jgi:hypothetical protein
VFLNTIGHSRKGEMCKMIPRSGQPKTHRADADVDRVRTLLRSDRRFGAGLIAEKLNMNRERVRQILMVDLGMRNISAKMVRQIFTDNQKRRCLTLRVFEFLAKKSITKMDHPPYSPDLTLCDNWLFPKLKYTLKGQGFLTFLIYNAT